MPGLGFASAFLTECTIPIYMIETFHQNQPGGFVKTLNSVQYLQGLPSWLSEHKGAKKGQRFIDGRNAGKSDMRRGKRDALQ